MVTAPSATYTLSLHDALPICAFGTTVGIECGKGLRFGADDGIAPAGREMNAARRAGGSIGCPADGDLRASRRDNHLGRVVGIDEPDRAIGERDQQAPAFVIGVDLADG